LRYVCSGLEFFLPHVLREVHPEWKHESLDGILPAIALKRADLELELIGCCILISDQTVTPFRVLLRVEPDADTPASLEAWLGENYGTEMLRIPYASNRWFRWMNRLSQEFDQIDWTYHVGFGERDETID